LPKVLHQAGIEYLPIDDTHFLYAGLEPDELKGVFITEEEGATVKLLPIQKKLRYLIPFGTVEKVIDELKRQADKNGGGLAVYADDGEKFGVWPKTFKHCYEDGWLEELFSALSRNSDWLEICWQSREVNQSAGLSTDLVPDASLVLPPRAFGNTRS
jgi:alpha-amylase